MAAAWVIGLVVIVGLAALGRAPAPGSAAPGIAVAMASVTPSATAGRARSVMLDQPAQRGEVVTTLELVVRGRVAADVGLVRIMLESSGGKAIATQSIDPTGYARGGKIPYEATFRLDKPRPGGSIVVYVVAIDTDGLPLDAVRRRIVLGAVLESRRFER